MARNDNNVWRKWREREIWRKMKWMNEIMKERIERWKRKKYEIMKRNESEIWNMYEEKYIFSKYIMKMRKWMKRKYLKIMREVCHLMKMKENRNEGLLKYKLRKYNVCEINMWWKW